MNPLLQWAAHPLVYRLGWTLLHFLWQGAVIAALFALAQTAWPKRSGNARYLTGCLALLLMLAAPLITFGVLPTERPIPAAISAGGQLLNPPGIAETSGSRAAVGQMSRIGQMGQPPAAFPPAPNPQFAIRNPQSQVPSFHPEHFLPLFVFAWLLGVSALSLRLLISSLHVARLKRRGHEPPGAAWLERLDRLKAALQISRPVRLVKSVLVEVPTVAGWLRPVVLLPAAALSGLTPAQLETVLAHELAHIRRHDYLVNLLQNALETLLFYHPAVWWISSAVRAEREICCDEIAVKVCGDRLVHAQALAALEQLRAARPSPALGADGGSLLERIRRLSGAPVGRGFPGRRRAGGALVAALVALIFISLLHHPSSNAKAQPALPAATTQASAAPAPANSAEPAENPSSLSLAIRGPTNVIKQGDEIPIEFIISNHGTEDYNTYAADTIYTTGRDERFKLIAKTASGQSVRDPYMHFHKGISSGLDTPAGSPLANIDSNAVVDFATPGVVYPAESGQPHRGSVLAIMNAGDDPGVLHPGESFSNIVQLNRWVLMKEPGRYEVTGNYQPSYFSTNNPIAPINADPISITVLPRTKEEMHDYINGLTNQVAAQLAIKAGNPKPAAGRDFPDPVLVELLCKLMYTYSPEIVPTLLTTSSEADTEGAWAVEALWDYVPQTKETRQAILDEAARHGLNQNMEQLLLDQDFNHQELTPIIERALALHNPDEWQAGAVLAAHYYDDVFAKPLIAIATASNAPLKARFAAFETLAAHRTDAGAKLFKTLLNDPDPQIWGPLIMAIENDYRRPMTQTGRPLQPGDFDAKDLTPFIEQLLASSAPSNVIRSVSLAEWSGDEALAASLAALAINPAASARVEAIHALALHRTEEGVKTLKTLLNDDEEEIWRPLAEAIEGVSSSGSPFPTRSHVRPEDFEAKEVRPLIERMLASSKLFDRSGGLGLALIFGDDALTPKLAALATNPGFAPRDGAIYVLAFNRTDEAVKTLRTLLNDPDPEISKMAERAIREAYTKRGAARGRPLRPDDFDAKYQQPEPTPALNLRPPESTNTPIPATTEANPQSAPSAVGPAKAEIRNPQSEISPSDWGEPVEGLQVRLHAPTPAIPGDAATRLLVDIGNAGNKNGQALTFLSNTNSFSWQLETDGRWYVTDRPSGGVELDVLPGQPLTNLPLVLNADWRIAHSNEVGTAILGGAGIFIPSHFLLYPETLKLSSGKHTVRLAVVAMAAAPYGPVRAVSNPVQIDVAPGANWRAALVGKYLPGYTLRTVQRLTGNQVSAVEILAAPSGEETDLASAMAAWRGVPVTLPPAGLAAPVSSEPGYCWRNPKLTTLLTELKLKLATASEAEDITRLILGLFKGWTSFGDWSLKTERCEYGWIVTPSYVGPPAQVMFQGPVELIVEDGVLVDARMGGDMPPHPAGVSNRMADAAEPGWGEPVEGLSMRLQSDKPVWYLASDSPGFRLSVRNLGGEVLSVPESEELGELELDGVWYAWSDKYYGPFQSLAPGRQVDNLAVFPISSWGKDPRQFPTGAGTHKIRFALVARRDQPHRGQTIRVVSNPIEVEFRDGLAPKETVQPGSQH